MFSCPSCGGKMYFDIQSQKLKCSHCGSQTAVEDYRLNNDAEQHAEDDMTIYTCRNCGAQLVSPDQSAVAFCSYCGSEQILEENRDLAKEVSAAFSAAAESIRTFMSELSSDLPGLFAGGGYGITTENLPVAAGMWKQHELWDGTYTLDDLLDVAELIQVRWENEERAAEATRS